MHEFSQLALGFFVVSFTATWAWRRGLALRRVHRASAMALALFLAAHLQGHLTMLAGPATQQAVLETLRVVYRQPVVEGLLLGCVLLQAGSGLTLLWRSRLRRRRGVAWLQAASGAYLALFLAIHVSAVLHGRYQGLDTNFAFAAAGMHIPPWQWFFVPYYFLAVFALFAHVGCAIYGHLPQERRQRVLQGALLAGLLLGAGLVMLLARHPPAGTA